MKTLSILTSGYPYSSQGRASPGLPPGQEAVLQKAKYFPQVNPSISA
jgi:hypothetical protein